MDVKLKLWLVADSGKGVLGEGRCRLLRQIERDQSLQKAAEALGMSYRKAWGDVREMEQRLGFELVRRRRGGAGGGASRLTQRGQELLTAFEQVRSKVQATAQKEYRQKLTKLLGKESRSGHSR